MDNYERLVQQSSIDKRTTTRPRTPQITIKARSVNHHVFTLASRTLCRRVRSRSIRYNEAPKAWEEEPETATSRSPAKLATTLGTLDIGVRGECSTCVDTASVDISKLRALGCDGIGGCGSCADGSGKRGGRVGNGDDIRGGRGSADRVGYLRECGRGRGGRCGGKRDS